MKLSESLRVERRQRLLDPLLGVFRFGLSVDLSSLSSSRAILILLGREGCASMPAGIIGFTAVGRPIILQLCRV
jgi:hypothetical protein